MRRDHFTLAVEDADPGAGDVGLEKETLLVYDPGGNLLRKDSLIPGGVEL